MGCKLSSQVEPLPKPSPKPVNLRDLEIYSQRLYWEYLGTGRKDILVSRLHENTKLPRDQIFKTKQSGIWAHPEIAEDFKSWANMIKIDI
uniref:Uncharacterized protein n=1 Tax=viral metagenome TaxID=1070528 RepID=A0A6C0BMV0_9ZZZZ